MPTNAMAFASASIRQVPQSPQAAAANFNAASAQGTQYIEVPPNTNVPAALAPQDSSSALDPVSQKEIATIADGFLNSVNQATAAGEMRAAAWRTQQQLADDLIRTQQGVDVFLIESSRAHDAAR